jgi:hypothetical protein
LAHDGLLHFSLKVTYDELLVIRSHYFVGQRPFDELALLEKRPDLQKSYETFTI